LQSNKLRCPKPKNGNRKKRLTAAEPVFHCPLRPIAVRGTSWNFSKIPILAPGAAEPFQAPRLACGAGSTRRGQVIRWEQTDPAISLKAATQIDAGTASIKRREKHGVSRENETGLTTENEKRARHIPRSLEMSHRQGDRQCDRGQRDAETRVALGARLPNPCVSVTEFHWPPCCF
jgi:hypothetical protein